MRSDTAIWVSAGATTLAALVALFGPGVRRWWSRPRMVLHRPTDVVRSLTELILVPGESDETSSKKQLVLLDVTNHGRTQLEDVEAVLTAYDEFAVPPDTDGDAEDEIPSFQLEVVSRGLLQFELADPHNPRVTIPPRSTRTLRLAFLATDDVARGELRQRGEDLPTDVIEICGGWTVWPLADADRMTWLKDNESMTIEIALTAGNARSRTWRATVRAWHWSGMKDEPGEISGVELKWEKGLRRVRGSLPPTPRRAWVARHTPWALWRERQFHKEMEQARAEVSEDDRASP